MKTTIVALLNQNGTIEYIEFEYEKEICLFNIERIIKNKGETLEVIEEGCIGMNRDFVLVGYKSGDKFNKHEINSCNIKGDAVLIILSDEEYTDTTELDTKRYFTYYELESSEELELGLDEYDFSDGFLINDL